MFDIKGIHHIAISVPSLSAARAFYVDKLGFTVADEERIPASELGDKVTALKNADCNMLMLNAGNLFLEIFEYHSPAPKKQDNRPVCDHGYTHLSFEVGEIQAAYDFLAEAGVEWHHPPVEAAEGYQMAYGRDPFGNVIEIQQVAGGTPCSFDQLSMARN